MELELLPRRRFLSGPNELPKRDELGFFQEDPAVPSFGCRELLEITAAVVLEPPWTRKTFTASAIEGYFRQRKDDTDTVQYHLTKLQQGMGASLEPDWWQSWRESPPRPYWIVDSLDEEKRHRSGNVFQVVNRVGQLSKAERDRLTLLLFCRESEVPSDVIDELCAGYPPRRNARRAEQSAYPHRSSTEERVFCLLELPGRNPLHKSSLGDFVQLCRSRYSALPDRGIGRRRGRGAPWCFLAATALGRRQRRA